MKNVDIGASVNARVLPDGRMIADMRPSRLASALTALGIEGVSASDGKVQLIRTFNAHLGDIAAEAGRLAVKEWYQANPELPAPPPPAVPDNDSEDDGQDAPERG